MSEQNRFPPGWDDERMKRLIGYYDKLSEDELAAADDAAAEEQNGKTVITVPDSLLPAIRLLLAKYKSA